MFVSQYSLALYLAIAVMGGFALGVWVQRIFVWYPFGVRPLTGKESMIGKTAVVTLVKDQYVEVKYDSQIWRAHSNISMNLVPGDTVWIRDVISNTLVIDDMGNYKGSKK